MECTERESFKLNIIINIYKYEYVHSNKLLRMNNSNGEWPSGDGHRRRPPSCVEGNEYSVSRVFRSSEMDEEGEEGGGMERNPNEMIAKRKGIPPVER